MFNNSNRPTVPAHPVYLRVRHNQLIPIRYGLQPSALHMREPSQGLSSIYQRCTVRLRPLVISSCQTKRLIVYALKVLPHPVRYTPA